MTDNPPQPSPDGLPPASPPPEREADAFLGRSRLAEHSIRTHMVRGTAWAVGWRWAMRAIGLVSTIILARLLTPADFGLVAMAMVVVGFVEIFGYTGMALALIRITDPAREHYDTAWTLQVMTGIVLAGVMILAAPYAAIYFKDPRVTVLIYFLSLRPFFEGFENIGVVAFRANLDFSKDFRYGIYQKLTTFVIGVGLAILLRNYWALAIAIVFSRLASTVISYLMHPFRPRFSLARTREIFSFSMWTLATQVGEYLSTKFDEFVVGGLFGTTAMGDYAVASDFAAAPTIELVVPMSRGLFPVYSQFAEDRERLRDAYLGVLSIAALLCFSAATGVAVVSHDLVHVVLGTKWLSAAPLITWLALGSAAMALADGIFAIFSVSGQPAIASRAVFWRLLVLVPGVTLAGWHWGSEGIAAARALIYIVMLPSLFLMLKKVLPITGGDILARLWRPFLAALLMAGAVHLFIGLGPDLAALRLALSVVIGIIVFGTVNFILWRLAGRPSGAEETAMAAAARIWRRTALRRRFIGEP